MVWPEAKFEVRSSKFEIRSLSRKCEVQSPIEARGRTSAIGYRISDIGYQTPDIGHRVIEPQSGQLSEN